MAKLHEVGLIAGEDGKVAWRNWGEENPEILVSAHWHTVFIRTECEFRPEAIQEYLRQSVKHVEVTRVEAGDVVYTSAFLGSTPIYRLFYPFGNDELPGLILECISRLEDRVMAYEQLHAVVDMLVPEEKELVFETELQTEESVPHRDGGGHTLRGAVAAEDRRHIGLGE